MVQCLGEILNFLKVSELSIDPKFTATHTTDCRSRNDVEIPHPATPPAILSIPEDQGKEYLWSWSCCASITRLSTLSAAGSRVPAKVWLDI